MLDPAWREAWLADENPSTLTHAQNGTGPVFGLRFHQETERLTRWLVSPAHLHAAAAINSADELVEIAWRSSLQSFTDQLLASRRGEEAVAFTDRMRSFCARLIELKRRTQRFENWQDVFIATEQNILDVRVPVGTSSVEIAARVDAIRFHPQHHLEVVDYKLSQGTQQEPDLVQLATYAHILPLWRPGCEFCGTLEYYLPDFMEVTVSNGDLASIYSGLVDPVLREMFGQRTAGRKAPSPPRGDDVSGAALGKRIAEAFGAFGLVVQAAGLVEGPQVRRIKLVPGTGVKVASLANRAEDLQVALTLDAAPLIKAGRGFVLVDLPRDDRRTILLADFLKIPAAKAASSAVSFPVGIGIEGEPILADFCDSNTCHALVAGTSGSGKSEWLKMMVAALAHKNTPERLQVALVDPKILTFSGVSKSPYLWRPIANDLDSARAVLQAAVTEMEGRYQILAREGLLSLAERFEAGRFDIPFLVLVFDEFADLILTGRNEKKAFEEMVARIAGKGRAAGIHLVLATQRPDSKVVTGLIKSNLPMKICLRVTNATNSQIVLDEPGAESLLGKGDLLSDLGRGVVRAQSYYAPHADFLMAMRA